MARLRPRVMYVGSGVLATAQAAGTTADPYAAQVVKYIPAEAITAYQAVLGTLTLAPATDQGAYISITAWVCIAFAFLWTLLGAKDNSEPLAWSQAIVATLGFFVWLFAVDSPSIHNFAPISPVGRSVVLILATILVLPLVGRVLHRWIGN